MTFTNKRSGFTLIELLVVIAILATIAGGILVSYDGLETDAAQGQATFNIGATDRAVRTYKTLNKVFPTNLDSLMFSPDGTGTDTVAGLNLLNSKIRGKIGVHTLLAGGATALTNAGITQLRYVAGDVPSEGAGTPAANYVNTTPGTLPFIPNRVFDNTTRGWGESVNVAAGVKVAIMETIGVTTLSGSAATTSARLRDIAGLDETLTHHVVVVGLGNNSSMVAEAQLGTALGRTGTLAEAPYYTNLTKFEYGRYLLLFHIGSSTATSAGVVSYFPEAKFIAVLDTKGDWLDEEMAEYNNSKL